MRLDSNFDPGIHLQLGAPSGERRPLACSFRRPAGNILPRLRFEKRTSLWAGRPKKQASGLRSPK